METLLLVCVCVYEFVYSAAYVLLEKVGCLHRLCNILSIHLHTEQSLSYVYMALVDSKSEQHNNSNGVGKFPVKKQDKVANHGYYC